MLEASLFDPYPVDAPQVHAAAEATRGRLDLVTTLQATVEQNHQALMTAIEGDLRTSAQDAPTEVLSTASTVQQQAHYAAGCLEEFGRSVDRYNETSSDPRSISGLNAAYRDAMSNDFGALYSAPAADASPQQRDDAVDLFHQRRAGAEAVVVGSLNAEKARLDIALDDSAAQVKAMLDRGPNAADIKTMFRSGSLPSYAPVIFTDVRFSFWDRMLASMAGSVGATGVESDELRVMTLNIGGGWKNERRNSEGMDPGDADEVARRIINQEVDVATLQEVWDMDLDEIQHSLNELDPGGNWEIEFQSASHKARAIDDWVGDVYFDQPFGNAVAVRQGDNELTYERVDLGDDAKLDEPGDDGSDGRAMIMVAVTTSSGATVNVSTAHTDYEGVTVEAQAEQIEDLRETTEQYGGGAPSIITGDLNHAITDDTPQGEALQDFVDDGYTDAGESVGATSDFGHGRRIDYVFTSEGLVAGDADRVQGDSPDTEGEDREMSDHDGIVVDVDVPAPTDGVGSGGGGGGSGSW